MSNARHSRSRIFLAPAVIAGVVVFGLVSALFGDDIWDQASWVALTIPLAVIACSLARRPAHRPAHARKKPS